MVVERSPPVVVPTDNEHAAARVLRLVVDRRDVEELVDLPRESDQLLGETLDDGADH
jgi:hypothetical protein